MKQAKQLHHVLKHDCGTCGKLKDAISQRDEALALAKAGGERVNFLKASLAASYSKRDVLEFQLTLARTEADHAKSILRRVKTVGIMVGGTAMFLALILATS